MARGITTGRPYFHSTREIDGPFDGTVEPNVVVELLESAPIDEYWSVRLADSREGFIHQDIIRVLDDSPAAAGLIDSPYASTTVHQFEGDSVFFFEAGMRIDADGAPNAYGPGNSGLDFTDNAKDGDEWVGVLTRDGEPIVQGPNDVAPGFYVTTTSLVDPDFAEADPRRYVDAARVPYFVLPLQIEDRYGASLGDLGYVLNRGNGFACGAILADRGPRNKLGEGSIALAAALGLPSNPRFDSTPSGVIYVVFPGSGNQRPLPADDVRARGGDLFAAWSGMSKLTPFLT